MSRPNLSQSPIRFNNSPGGGNHMKLLRSMLAVASACIAAFSVVLFFSGIAVAEEHVTNRWLTKDAAGFFTFLLVIVGATQAYLFVRQLQVIRISLDEAKKTTAVAKAAADAARHQAENAKLQLRAFVGVTGVKIRDFDGEYAPNVSVTFKNCGCTPAYKLANTFDCIFSFGPNKSRKNKPASASYADLFPDQDRSTTAVLPKPLWNSNKEAVIKGGIKFIVSGQIIYRDMFDLPHYISLNCCPMMMELTRTLSFSAAKRSGAN